MSNHNDAKGGYLKFFPKETKYIKDIDSGEIIPATINNHGFRGKDFTTSKPNDVIRVLTLGASSTFGFFNRDKETYPVLLEQKLNKRCQGPKRFEVINFAIPHAGAEEIRSMFVAEGLALSPDVITFYEGRNDSNRLNPMEFRSATSRKAKNAGDFLQQLRKAMIRTFVLARLLDELSGSASEVSARNALGSLDSVGTRTSKAFLTDLDQIRILAKRRGILFIVANQQANSKSWFGIPQAERMTMQGVTYGDEVAKINHILQRGEPISGYEFNFLIHARLMHDLRAWATENTLPFVDVISLLDHDRHHLVSWVHLDAYANGLIANALADEILKHQCPEAKS